MLSELMPTALGVLAGSGIVLDLHNVLVGNQSGKTAVLVHYEEFFDLVAPQELRRLLEIGTVGGGNQVLLGHHLGYRSLGVVLETQVAVGDDAAKHAAGVHDGDTSDMVLMHEVEGIADRGVLPYGHGIVDHSVLSPLDLAHLLHLDFDGHILVYHSDTAFTGNGYRQVSLSHGIHGRRDYGGMERNLPGQLRSDVHLAGQHVRVGRNEEDIIESEALHYG